MITDEFEHYFRILMPRTISSEEARNFLFAVNDVVPAQADDKDVVMVYHEDENAHCYDVRLSKDISGDEGDEILYNLEELFPNDDFDCESSMNNIEEQQYLNRAVMEQLSTKLI
jgi:hypothetical protein